MRARLTFVRGRRRRVWAFAPCLGALIVGVAFCACGSSRAADGAPPAAAADARAVAPSSSAAPAPAVPVSDTVRIVVTLVPATATGKVMWGKKVLGVVPPRKPLVLLRPRDSGPLDIVVRADGFLPVQTRVYTFADSKLGVKLTTPEEKKTLLGYREPPPPPPEGAVAPGAAGAVPVVPGAAPTEPSPAPADAGLPP